MEVTAGHPCEDSSGSQGLTLKATFPTDPGLGAEQEKLVEEKSSRWLRQNGPFVHNAEAK